MVSKKFSKSSCSLGDQRLEDQTCIIELRKVRALATKE